MKWFRRPNAHLCFCAYGDVAAPDYRALLRECLQADWELLQWEERVIIPQSVVWCSAESDLENMVELLARYLQEDRDDLAESFAGKPGIRWRQEVLLAKSRATRYCVARTVLYPAVGKGSARYFRYVRILRGGKYLLDVDAEAETEAEPAPAPSKSPGGS